MHSFPWWGDLLFSALALLVSWQFWAVLGLVAVGLLAVWLGKRKS